MGQLTFPYYRPAELRDERQLATVIVDTEEDFDWNVPVEGTNHDTSYLSHLADLHIIWKAHRIKPTYLLTYPVLENTSFVFRLRRLLDVGQCSLGVQLHSWVTPPFEGRQNMASSFAGNLSGELEVAKLSRLIERFIECFGDPPKIFRAGRYGLGPRTPDLLEEFGFDVDTSVAPRSSMLDKQGPDFSQYDFQAFWFGRSRAILELPLCRSIIGWGGAAGVALYQAILGRKPRQSNPALGVLAAFRVAERVTLSPEGNDVGAMRRLVSGLQARGATVLPVSFHSSSLWPGHNPYVRDKQGLHQFYDRLSEILGHLSEERGCHFVAAPDLPGMFSIPRAAVS
jgi:hypothetical protein